MKKWILISLLVCAFLFLGIRMIVNNVNDSDSERQWYISQLGFEFSGEVDSVIMHGKYHGLLLFRITKGKIDKSKERKLQHKLKGNGRLDLFVHQPEGKFEMITPIAYKYQRGDSIYVNTNEDRISLYRKNKLISQYEVMASLRSAPF
jgi:hypothetical protein